MSSSLKEKIRKADIIIRRENKLQHKYYVGGLGGPSATILNRNRAMPTELIPYYDPAEAREERLDRELELERAADVHTEEARVLNLKEIADRALEESKVKPTDSPKIKPGAPGTPDRPKPAFLGDIGTIGKTKLTPAMDRTLP